MVQGCSAVIDAMPDKPASYDSTRPAAAAPAVKINWTIRSDRAVDPVKNLHHCFSGRNVEVPDRSPFTVNLETELLRDALNEGLVRYKWFPVVIRLVLLHQVHKVPDTAFQESTQFLLHGSAVPVPGVEAGEECVGNYPVGPWKRNIQRLCHEVNFIPIYKGMFVP